MTVNYKELWLQIVLLTLALLLLLSQYAFAQDRKHIENLIIAEALQAGVDPGLAVAIAKTESGLDDSKVGKLGEIGVLQLRPEYHPNLIPGNTAHNIRIGMRYLAHLRDVCGVRYGNAFFICFNLGENYKRIKHPKLFPYYKRVMALRERQ